MRSDTTRLATAHFVHAMVAAKGSMTGALAFLEGQKHLPAQTTALSAIRQMSAVGGSGTSDFDGAGVGGGVASGFVNQVRDESLLGRLTGIQRFPFDRRVFVSALGASAAEIAEGAAVPASKGAWSAIYLRRRLFAGLTVQSRELVLGDQGAQLALLDDLAAAVAEQIDRAFASPVAVGSVTNGGTEITATGTTAAQLLADVSALANAVPTAYKDGVYLMPQTTATFMGTVLTTGGARAFPDIEVNGGRLLNLPVVITSALGQPGSPPTNAIALVSPSQVLHAIEDRVGLALSTQASIEMTDAPTGDSSDGTAGTTSLVSMWQSDSVAVKGAIYADFYARPGAAAYVTVGF